MNKNYKLLKNEYIKDISSDGFIYEHKSGAKIVFMKNDDDNRVFSITFRTLPENNKGIAHIIEHSVLCGSRKYPVKDPFNELSKGSLNTYLNAMTFEDKTMYPIASTNEKDFINLMNVYLDAVFFPLIYDRKGIFLQEGHHKEKDKINGVVYNEMKGVFSSPDRIMDFKLNEQLFSETNYKFYSGGVPEFIPELTYDEFLDFHRKYYHPANSIIYLYGDLDIDKYLDMIDKEYLSEFKFKKVQTEYKVQKDFDKIKDVSFSYNVSEQENNDDNYLQCGVIIDKKPDFKLAFAFDVLADVLLETDASPLKKALIKENIGNRINSGFDNGVFQPAFYVAVEKTKCNNLEKFKKVYFDTLNEIVENGIDRQLVESCINRYRFYFKEEDYGYKPKGLFYNILMINSFIYGDGNFDGLKFKDFFEYVENIDFTEIIKKYLIDNKNYVFAIMSPEVKEISEKQNYKEDKEFFEYNNIKDTEEDIKKVPVLDIKDIDKKSKNIDILESEICGRKLISSRIENDEIIYVDLLFDTKIFDIDDLKYVALFKTLFGKCSTKNYSYEDIANEINFYFGELSATIDNYTREDEFFNFLTLNMKFLNKNLSNVFGILDEVLFNTIFDKKRIKEVLSEYKLKMDRSFISSGHAYGIERVISHLSKSTKYYQNFKGVDFYKFIKETLENYEDRADVLISRLKQITEKAFNLNCLTVAIVCGNDNYNAVFDNVKNFCSKLPDNDVVIKNIDITTELKNEAFSLASEVQYNTMAIDFQKYGLAFNGHMKVFENMIESNYLWDKIRIEGGAYGGGCGFSRKGVFFAYSYRDPNIEKTFENYKKIPEYLRSIKLTERELQKFIIGTINKLDRPIKISNVIDKILNRKISEITDEERQKERNEILNIKIEDISKFGEMFEDCFSENVICTFGNKAVVEENKMLYDVVDDSLLK